MSRTSRSIAAALTTCLAATSLAATADEAPSSRIIVSSTLNHGLLILDADSLEFTQPMLPSAGTSPVRMDVQTIDGMPLLFTANHGVAGSLGIFDLTGDRILETPASPIPTGGAGSVGIDVSPDGIVAVTNTWFALGGCSMPKGSVSVFLTTATGGVVATHLRNNLEVEGAIPYAAAVGEHGDVFASTNCGDSLETYEEFILETPAVGLRQWRHAASTPIGAGPDATLFDAERDLVYIVNIGGDSVSVVDADTRTVGTTVAMANSGPIDAALGTLPSGRDVLLTGNGQDDTFSILDRDTLAACSVSQAETCPGALVARIDAGVEGGAPEGISYDPVSNRVFVVNKSPIGAPSLSAVQLTEDGSSVTGTVAGIVPLPAADPALPVPAIIAFDVVVDVRA